MKYRCIETMKNYSKNKYSGKNSNRFRKKSESNNSSNAEDFFEDKKLPLKGNKYAKQSSNKKSQFNQSQLNKRKHNNFPFNANKNKSNTLIPESSNYLKNNLEKFSKKRNFEDWIWGKHSVYSALTGDRPINRIWCTAEVYSSERFYILFKDLKSKGVLIEEVSWNRLSQLTFGAAHQGIAMQLAFKNSLPLNELIDLSKANCNNPIILALDGITDPHNLGAIIRSAEAFNCRGIILPQRRSAGLTGTVAKVAAGALEHIPFSRVVNLNRALEEIKKHGFLTVGLNGDAQLPISKFSEKAPLLVIIGAEDKGISLLTQKKCDFLLKIPLKGKTSSLNASNAAAISLFYLTNL